MEEGPKRFALLKGRTVLVEDENGRIVDQYDGMALTAAYFGANSADEFESTYGFRWIPPKWMVDRVKV